MGHVQVELKCLDDVLPYLAQVQQNRTVNATLMNKGSSRSVGVDSSLMNQLSTQPSTLII